MVHSLCRAGTVSASLLNGNQQANPASGSADDKGMPKAYNSDKAAEKSVNTYRRQRGKQTSFGSQKKCLSKIHRRKQDFKNRHNTFACCHKKTML